MNEKYSTLQEAKEKLVGDKKYLLEVYDKANNDTYYFAMTEKEYDNFIFNELDKQADKINLFVVMDDIKFIIC